MSLGSPIEARQSELILVTHSSCFWPKTSSSQRCGSSTEVVALLLLLAAAVIIFVEKLFTGTNDDAIEMNDEMIMSPIVRIVVALWWR